MISINENTKHKMKKKVTKKAGAGGAMSARGTGTKKKGSSKGTNATKKRGTAPPLIPKSLTTSESISSIKALSTEELKNRVDELFSATIGESAPVFDPKSGSMSSPRMQSTTAERGGAAADLATIAKECDIVTVLKKFNVLEKLEVQLLPDGIGSLFGNEKGLNPGGGMRKITSNLSLASLGADSLDDGSTAPSTIISDSKRGKLTASEAREGCLLLLRALSQVVGAQAEPFIVPLFAATLEECGSSSSMVREAAEDAAQSILSLVSEYGISIFIAPIIFEALHSPEWRVKAVALSQLAECAKLHPTPISKLLPQIIPIVTSQVWDTKPQVTAAAKSSLLACCETNQNPDIKPAIPAVVNAICKPTDTVKAVDQLKMTTFVMTVDATTLSILCPVLSRGLKDKMAINKRSCCIVIENMSKLVETPAAVAPFGPLLVPDLKKVAENVQFEEIRDAALAALNALTKALGHGTIDDAVSHIMKEENDRIAAEQNRIEEERAAEVERERLAKLKEEEERKLWREAMEAERELQKLALKEEEEKKAEAEKKKEKAKKSTKGSGGKCQGCGLKKCKKGCLFA